MNRLVSGGLWNEVKQLAKKSRGRMAAIAYVTSENVRFRKGDLLIVDASKQAIESGQTSATVLRRALKRGAELYSCPGLHAKVMILDGVAVIGSANLSISSEKSLVEAALLTDHPGAVATTRAFLEKLRGNSARIDEKFVEKISATEVKKVNFGRFNPKKKRGLSIKPDQHRTWLATLYPLDEERYPSEARHIEKGTEKAESLLSKPSSSVSWIRLAGTSSLFQREARAGDSVIQICMPSRKAKRPDTVYPRSTILLRQRELGCIRLFWEDPADSDKFVLKWGEFQKLIRRMGLPFKIGRYTMRLLPEEYADALAPLWKEMKKRK